MIKRLIRWWFLRQNGYPSPGEVSDLLFKTPLISRKIMEVAMTYEFCGDLRKTAETHNITTERARQFLLKLRRSCQNVESDVRSTSHVSLFQDDDM